MLLAIRVLSHIFFVRKRQFANFQRNFEWILLNTCLNSVTSFVAFYRGHWSLNINVTNMPIVLESTKLSI